MKGLCIALVFEVVVGMIEFNLQSHQFLEIFHLHWPGLIDAASAGASILKYPDGQNFLRVYGTLPHPNMLGGFILICMTAVIWFILDVKKTNWFAWPLLGLGVCLLILTFSRAAWLGFVVFLFVLLLKSKYLERNKIWLLLFVVAMTAALTLFPLRDLFISRTSVPTTATEEFSLTGRVWLAEQALTYMKERPITGIGMGSFVIQLAQRAGERNFVEPVHNIPLLILSELGIIGLILLFSILISIGREFWSTKRTNLILMGALLAGIGTITLFDHYFWSLAPGRMMLGLVFGLWFGQASKDDE